MKKIIKPVLFLAIFGTLFSACVTVFTHPASDIDASKYIPGFYKEPNNTLQAVYIGASNAFCFWAAPLAWEHYGITVYPFASGGQKLEAVKYLLEEARKTQPDALFIVGIAQSNLDPGGMPDARIHNLADYIPLSANKLALLRELCDEREIPWKDRAEYYVPLIRYHSRWNNLTVNDFKNDFGNFKGGDIHPGILGGVVDFSATYRETSRREELSDFQTLYLADLLQYCKDEELNMLFVLTNFVATDESQYARLNTVGDFCRDYGFPVLDMREKNDEIGIDLTKDYYNANHVNVHGMIKTTDYLSRYLIENYGFEDRRGDPAYRSWDEAYDEYVDIVSHYMLDFEYENGSRDFTLKAPELTKVAVNGTKLTLSWKEVPNASGYVVYRKSANAGWAPVSTLERGTLSYADTDCVIGEKYTYTVASFREEGGVRYWGTYDFTGLSATAAMNAPKELKAEGTKDALTVSWKKVSGAAGYQVARQVLGKSWVNQTTVEKTSWTDTNMLEAMPYQYRVRAYWYKKEDEAKETPIYGSWSAAVPYLQELEPLVLEGRLSDGVPVLSWNLVEGATGYKVYRATGEDGWEQIAEPLAANVVEFRDITAKKGTAYRYQVEAYLTCGEETITYPSEEVALTAAAEAVPLKAPEILFAEQVGSNVQLVWEPSDNATAYRLYRRAEGDETWKVVKSSVTGSAYQEKMPDAEEIAYLLQPLRQESGIVYYGEFDENAARTITKTPGEP